ncbi:MAG TPA: hypothetical protein VGJ73_10570, partial [Verrucomicrobiae bacterium]
MIRKIHTLSTLRRAANPSSPGSGDESGNCSDHRFHGFDSIARAMRAQRRNIVMRQPAAINPNATGS